MRQFVIPGALSLALAGPAFVSLIGCADGGWGTRSRSLPPEPIPQPERPPDLILKDTIGDKIVLSVPFNFVSTTDVIGGNSGSPVINRNGEIVGLVFDINLHSLVWDIAYTDRQGRTVNVDARAIIEALRTIYGADRIVREIVGG